MLASPDTNRDVETLRSNGVEGKPTSVVADGSCKEETVPDVNILDVARQYLSRLSDGAEPEELDSFFAPDVVQEEFPNRLLPHGAARNLQAMKEARARGRALLKEERFELVNAIAGDGKVAMEVIWTATVRDAAGPFAAGQALRARFALFMEFRDGRIVRQHNYDCFDPW
jgi:ketosteroid isomerase-like protein